eukprot:3902896-Rhodomonas_salina.1
MSGSDMRDDATQAYRPVHKAWRRKTGLLYLAACKSFRRMRDGRLCTLRARAAMVSATNCASPLRLEENGRSEAPCPGRTVAFVSAKDREAHVSRQTRSPGRSIAKFGILCLSSST